MGFARFVIKLKNKVKRRFGNGEKMSYSKIEYYENGNVKSVAVKGFFVSFKGSIVDLEKKNPKVRGQNE